METAPVMCAPAVGPEIATQGGTGLPTVTLAIPVNPALVASTVPLTPMGGCAENRTLAPDEELRVPTPFVTTHANDAPGTKLSHASYAVALKVWLSEGR